MGTVIVSERVLGLANASDQQVSRKELGIPLIGAWGAANGRTIE